MYRRKAWDLFIVAPCLFYLGIMIPYYLCFNAFTPHSLVPFEALVDVIFLTDILINFRTGYETSVEGEVEYDNYRAAKNYLCSPYAPTFDTLYHHHIDTHFIHTSDH